MNNNAKILLTIHLEGGTLVRKSSPEIVVATYQKQSYSSTTKKWGNPGETVTTHARHFGNDVKPCVLKVTLTDYAYNYMISSEIPEFWEKSKAGVWSKKLKPEDRLKIHLNKICRHHGGKYFTYEILED